MAAVPTGNTYVTTGQLGSLRLFNQLNGSSTNPLNNKTYTDPNYAVKGSDGSVTGYNLPNDIYAQALNGNAQNNKYGLGSRGAQIVAYGTAAPGAAPVTAAPITNATPVAAAPSTAAPASATSVVNGGDGSAASAAAPTTVTTPAGPPPVKLADIMQSGVAPSQQNPTGANGAPLAWQNGQLAADPTWDGVDRSQQQAPAKQNNASTINIGGRIIRNPIFPDGASVGGGVIS